MFKTIFSLIIITIGLSPSSYAWNSDRHQQYENELADWWIENRDIIYPEEICDKATNAFKTIPLVGLWAMNSDGTAVSDESGNGHDMQEDGSLDYSTTSDPCITYMTINSGFEGLKLESPTAIEPPAGTITYGGWFRFHEMPAQSQLKTILGIEEVFELEISNYMIRPIRFDEGGSAAWVESGQDIATNTWYFIAVKDTPAGTTLYINDTRLYGANPAGLDFTENDVNRPFRIGGKGEAAEFALEGDYAFVFVSHSAVTDKSLEFLYANTRDFFQAQSVTDAIATYQAIDGLQAFWSMASISQDRTTIQDDSPNKLNLTVSQSAHLEQLETIGKVPFSRFDYGLNTVVDTGASVPSAPELEIRDEVTIGMWTKVGNISTGGMILRKGEGGGTFPPQIPYALGNDSEEGFIANFADENGGWHNIEILTAEFTGDPLAPRIGFDWRFVVARYKKGERISLTVDTYTKEQSAPNASLLHSTLPLYLPAINSHGEDPIELDTSLVFVSNVYLPDSDLIALYKKTRGLFK